VLRDFTPTAASANPAQLMPDEGTLVYRRLVAMEQANLWFMAIGDRVAHAWHRHWGEFGTAVGWVIPSSLN
jgi:hypothetical protein